MLRVLVGTFAWNYLADRAKLLATPGGEGSYDLLVRAGDQQVVKRLRVGGGWGAVSTLRTGKNLLDKLLYPGETPIPAGAIESIEVLHEPLGLDLFGWSVNWLVFFFVVSILAGFAFRRVMGVEI